MIAENLPFCLLCVHRVSAVQWRARNLAQITKILRALNRPGARAIRAEMYFYCCLLVSIRG